MHDLVSKDVEALLNIVGTTIADIMGLAEGGRAVQHISVEKIAGCTSPI